MDDNAYELLCAVACYRCGYVAGVVDVDVDHEVCPACKEHSLVSFDTALNILNARKMSTLEYCGEEIDIES